MRKSTEQLAKAHELGRTAFHNGIGSAPAQDARVLDMLRGRKIGKTPKGEAKTVSILTAWSRGWHTENVKAIV